MKVKVVDYSAAWPVLYQQEAARIRAILADNFVAIYHIGSTAVERLAAKPIIDIMPVVKKIHLVDACNPVSYTHLDVYKRQTIRYYP